MEFSTIIRCSSDKNRFIIQLPDWKLTNKHFTLKLLNISMPLEDNIYSDLALQPSPYWPTNPLPIGYVSNDPLYFTTKYETLSQFQNQALNIYIDTCSNKSYNQQGLSTQQIAQAFIGRTELEALKLVQNKQDIILEPNQKSVEISLSLSLFSHLISNTPIITNGNDSYTLYPGQNEVPFPMSRTWYMFNKWGGNIYNSIINYTFQLTSW